MSDGQENRSRVEREQSAMSKEMEKILRWCVKQRNGKDLLSLLDRLSAEPSVTVRRRAAEMAGMAESIEIEQVEEIIRRLAGDADASVREAAAEGLGKLLGRAGQMKRVRIVGEWATSADRTQREAIAKSLRGYLNVLGDAPAIEHLSDDPEAPVRQATADAATARAPTRPRRYADVLEKLSHDSNESVRIAARAGLNMTRKTYPEQGRGGA